MYRTRFNPSPAHGMENQGRLRQAISAILLIVVLTGCTATPQESPPNTETPIPSEVPPTETPIPMVPPGDSERTVMVGDLERSYLLHIPPNLEVSTSVAVVFLFHGSERSAIQFQPFGFRELADEKEFVIITPNGTTQNSEAPNELSWNAGTCCNDPVINNIDEAAFIHEILADLESVITVDPKRIYAHGYSNGGMVVYRLACEMSETFAAISPYAGALIYNPCQPQQPISILEIHGEKDTTVPFEGGFGVGVRDMAEGFPSTMEVVETWAQFNGCTESSQIETGDDNITHAIYADCEAGSVVEFITIKDQGHEYPRNAVLPMSEIIWNFFDAHPKQ